MGQVWYNEGLKEGNGKNDGSRNGHLLNIMGELETAGSVAKANGLNPATGRRSRVDQYRIRDNYTRFFLRYVAPRQR